MFIKNLIGVFYLFSILPYFGNKPLGESKYYKLSVSKFGKTLAVFFICLFIIIYILVAPSSLTLRELNGNMLFPFLFISFPILLQCIFVSIHGKFFVYEKSMVAWKLMINFIIKFACSFIVIILFKKLLF